jgi:glycosyltransferase involved in cell wall biosynthesis
MKIAIIVPDNRDELKQWGDLEPFFGNAPTALLEGFSKFPELEVHVITCSHRNMSSPERIYPNIWFHQILVPRIGWLTLYLGCVFAIRKLLNEIRPDIVHGQGSERYCALAAAFSGFPNIITLHGVMSSVSKHMQGKAKLYGLVAAMLENLSLKVSSKVLCISNYTKRHVDTLVKSTWLVPNPLLDEWFLNLSDARNAPVVAHAVVVANISPWKNQNHLLKLWSEKQPPPFSIEFLGHGDEASSYYHDFINLVSQRTWSKYRGFVKSNELRLLLDRCGFLIHPAKEENFGLVIIEAMARGIPVVASKAGGISDLIDDGVTGRLFDPNIENDMRAKIEAVYFEPELSKSMARKAQKVALEQFSSEAVARKHIEIYREITSVIPVKN